MAYNALSFNHYILFKYNCEYRGYQHTQAVIITASPTSLAGKLGLSETDQLILETQQLSQVSKLVFFHSFTVFVWTYL